MRFAVKYCLITISLITVTLCSTIAYSQPVTWYRTWGPQNTQIHAQGKRVCQTFDGGFAVLSLLSFSNNWFDLLKYDELGNLQWEKLITDSTTSGKMLSDMQQTSDSGFIFSGFLPAGQGALLIKADKNGNIKWQRSYPNLNSGTRFWEVKQTFDKGFIACGSYIDYANPSTKGIVIKVDSLGFVQWERQYMDSTFNTFSGIIQGLNRNYYIAGSTYNNQRPDYSLLKILDTLGNVIKTNIFYQKSYMSYIIQLKDSSLVTGGEDKTTNTNYPLITKFSPSGVLKWTKTYPSTFHFYFYYMSKDLFDNIIMTGGYDKYTYSTILNWKLDTSGILLKTKEVNYSGYSSVSAACINPTIDSGYVITGIITLSGNNDALIIKTDSAFNCPSLTGVKYINLPISKTFKTFQNYPNPFNPVTNIKYQIQKTGLVSLKIYDITGREIKTLVNEIKNPGSYMVSFNGSEFASGVYFYRIQAGDFVQVKKMILLK